MQTVIVAGPPAGGKTSVIFHALSVLKKKGIRPAVVKIDCLETDDDGIYAKLDIPIAVGLSQDICPDHFYAVNFEEMVCWAKEQKAELLVFETAGLCHRCAPGIENVFTLCVVDCLSSIKAPRKIGPVITTSDLIVLTKSDLVSQAEREVFRAQLSLINPRALLLEVNGLTAGGAEVLAELISESEALGRNLATEESRLRHPLPTAICSYCMGEKRLGNKYQQGVVYKMDFTARGVSHFA